MHKCIGAIFSEFHLKLTANSAVYVFAHIFLFENPKIVQFSPVIRICRSQLWKENQQPPANPTNPNGQICRPISRAIRSNSGHPRKESIRVGKMRAISLKGYQCPLLSWIRTRVTRSYYSSSSLDGIQQSDAILHRRYIL